MTSNQLKYDSRSYEKLIDEESNSVPIDTQHFKAVSSGVYQRTSVLPSNVSNSSSSALSETKSENETQKKQGMKSCFGTCYKVWTFYQIIWSASYLWVIFDGIISTQEFDKFDCMIKVCILVQSIFAFSGARKENIEKIERALMLTYICLVMLIISSVSEAFEDLKEFKKFKDQSGDLKEFKKLKDQSEDLGAAFYFAIIFSDIIQIFLFLLFVTLPTIKARNRIRALSPSNQNSEGVVSDEMNDPIEKLSSWKFIIYKYWILAAFCWTMKDIGGIIYKYFSDGASVFERLTSDKAYLVSHLLRGWVVNVIFLVFLFLVFEGIRRKNLDKILRAIKLMKINCVIQFIEYCSSFYLNNASEAIEKSFEGKPEDQLELFHKVGGIYWVFFIGMLCMFLAYYIAYFYGACKVRNILKDHKKASYKL